MGSARADVTVPLQQTKSQWSIAKESPLQGNIHATIASLKWLNAFGDNLHADGELQIQAGIQEQCSNRILAARFRRKFTFGVNGAGYACSKAPWRAFSASGLHIDQLYFASHYITTG